MKQNRTSLDQLFDNNKFLTIFSIIVAILIWLIAAMTLDPARTEIVRRVPVNLSQQTEALTSLGLSVIEGGTAYVDVKVSGPLTVIGRLEPEDIPTTARIGNITERGVWPLDVIPASQGTSQEYQIVEYIPNKITVKLDRIDQKEFKIVDKPNGLAYADNFVEGAKYITPSKVTVTGPQSELEKIAQCIITTELAAPLSESFSEELPLVFLDAKGDQIDLEERQLKSDADKALLVYPVLATTELKLDVGFTNIPRNFPVERLREIMVSDYDTTRVAGPADLVGNITRLMLGYVDISALRPGNAAFSFPLSLPNEQLMHIDKFTNVKVVFDDTYWDRVVFDSVKPELLNIPPGYEATALASAIYNIEFVGDKDDLATLSAADIVAEVDLSERELSPGANNLPVRISAPTKGMVWAVDQKDLIVEIKEKS